METAEKLEWIHDSEDDIDEPAPVALELPLEFCSRFVVSEDDPRAALELE